MSINDFFSFSFFYSNVFKRVYLSFIVMMADAGDEDGCSSTIGCFNL